MKEIWKPLLTILITFLIFVLVVGGVSVVGFGLAKQTPWLYSATVVTDGVAFIGFYKFIMAIAKDAVDLRKSALEIEKTVLEISEKKRAAQTAESRIVTATLEEINTYAPSPFPKKTMAQSGVIALMLCVIASALVVRRYNLGVPPPPGPPPAPSPTPPYPTPSLPAPPVKGPPSVVLNGSRNAAVNELEVPFTRRYNCNSGELELSKFGDVFYTLAPKGSSGSPKALFAVASDRETNYWETSQLLEPNPTHKGVYQGFFRPRPVNIFPETISIRIALDGSLLTECKADPSNGWKE